VSAPVAVSGLAAGQVDQSPPVSEAWRAACEARIQICLAGRCAEARARRPNRDGWRRRMDDRERVANHEAGHIVGAVGVGRQQNGAVIEMVDHGCRGVAQHYQGAPPDLDHPTFDRFDELQRDFAMATTLAKLSVGQRGWLPYLRGLWVRTDAILGEHWLCVKMLSLELQRTGCVRRDRAQQTIDRWWHVRGDSVFEALKPRDATQ
jgi:hypothetical protein